MESNIVRDFENLRVFAKQNLISMDELVHDLNTALEETATGNAATEAATYNSALCKRYIKKRRGLRRPSANVYYWKKGTISEASESSVDEQSWHDLGINVVQSDSDDLVACRRIPKLSKPVIDSVPPVESDSFTENLSPMRPQRRRRKFKNMAIDSSPLTDHGPSDVDSLSGDKQHVYKRNTETTSVPAADYHTPYEPQKSSTSNNTPCTFMSGKRKRSSKCRVDYSSPQGDAPLQTMSKAIQDRMEVTSISQESSLSSSEFDSDINVNTEDAREADDEQSDFFHEPGPACGIPDIVPWWENERVTDKPLINSDFENILTGTFEHLPKYSSQGFKAKVGKLVSGAGREISLGRRKLKGKMPRYTVGRFLQDREHWSRLQDPHSVQMASNSNNNNSNNGQAGEFKKRRHQQRNCPGEGSSSAEPVVDLIKGCHKGSVTTSTNKSSSSPNMPVRRSCRKSGSSSISDL